MSRNQKNFQPPKPASTQQNWLSLLCAGAVGFVGAFLLVKGCPFSRMSCPVYSDACPVTTTLGKVEKAIARGDLPSAKSEAEKLADLLARSLPELSQSALRISKSNNLEQAKGALTEFQRKLETSSYPARRGSM